LKLKLPEPVLQSCRGGFVSLPKKAYTPTNGMVTNHPKDPSLLSLPKGREGWFNLTL
jgi:hypothetical protein